MLVEPRPGYGRRLLSSSIAVKVEPIAIEVLDRELAQSPGFLLERLDDLGP
jgi:hypothetical protein